MICDYAPGDLAWAEVTSALRARLSNDVQLHMTAVKSFDTIATGFVLAQLSLAPPELRPPEMLVFANTAPRKDTTTPKVANEGEGLLFAKLKNGIPVLAVNSGYSLSFVASEIDELWSTKAKEVGSQFRSRDFFPDIIKLACANDQSFLGKRLDIASIKPKPSSLVVAYVDSFGNLKTSLRSGEHLSTNFKPGTRVKVKIRDIIRTATVATGSFNVMEGDLAFAPGSSGHENRYWELFTRSGSASDEFGHPPTGSEIHIEV
jgi:S-adenosyl-l-methionine hydroxide adenosyltransferase